MRNRKTVMGAAAVLSALAVCAGCYTSHKIESTHEIKPIHITLDVNVKVDKALDDFFDDLDKKNAVTPAAPVQKVDDPIQGETAPAAKAPPRASAENTSNATN